MSKQMKNYFSERKYAIFFWYSTFDGVEKRVHFYSSRNPDGAVNEGFRFYNPIEPKLPSKWNFFHVEIIDNKSEEEVKDMRIPSVLPCSLYHN